MCLRRNSCSWISQCGFLKGRAMGCTKHTPNTRQQSLHLTKAYNSTTLASEPDDRNIVLRKLETVTPANSHQSWTDLVPWCMVTPPKAATRTESYMSTSGGCLACCGSTVSGPCHHCVTSQRTMPRLRTMEPVPFAESKKERLPSRFPARFR